MTIFFARAYGARKMHSLLPPNSIFRGYMNFYFCQNFLAHESFLGCFRTIFFNTCKIGKMLRAPTLFGPWIRPCCRVCTCTSV